jgi:phage shock protein C
MSELNTANPHAVFNRSDTFFGICEAVGQDFGVHPNILRVGLALGLFFNPVLAVGGYAAAGVAVLVSRLVAAPPRRKARPAEQPAPACDNAMLESFAQAA